MDAYLWLLPVVFPAIGFFWSNCPCCGCEDICADPNRPAEYSLTVSGYGNGSCASCTDYDGTYTLSYYPPFLSNPCGWKYDSTVPCDPSPGAVRRKWQLTFTCPDPVAPTLGLVAVQAGSPGANRGAFRTDWQGYGEQDVPFFSGFTECTYPASVHIEPL